MISNSGCDSFVTINLEFNSEINEIEDYSGCLGDGYNVTVNNILYNESNPTGVEQMISNSGCDSIVTINLEFNTQINSTASYNGCENDGYELIVNGVLYNESNPVGQETLLSASGCDSIVDIELEYLSRIENIIEYHGCMDDGFELMVNGILYNESNPTGQEQLLGASGCDSFVIIDFEFQNIIEHTITHVGCMGDGFSFSINANIYDENNPIGVELIDGGYDCDTLLMINLQFHSSSTFNETVQLSELQNNMLDIGQYIQHIDSISSISIAPTELVSCDNCVDPIFIGSESSVLEIAVVDNNGCVHNGTINVLNESSTSIYFPSVFSPNNDGVNDFFQGYTIVDQPRLIKSFDIFNRWGDKVFSRHSIMTDDATAEWDGTTNGNNAAEGVYVFVLVIFEDIDATTTRAHVGDLTLVR